MLQNYTPEKKTALQRHVGPAAAPRLIILSSSPTPSQLLRLLPQGRFPSCIIMAEMAATTGSAADPLEKGEPKMSPFENAFGESRLFQATVDRKSEKLPPILLVAGTSIC